MKILVLAAALPLAACAADPAPMMEAGYQPGALGLAAIERGDWDKAERSLTQMRGVAADDPARLINLGKVYMETGRRGEALTAWRRALASDRHHMVETVDGREVSTEELARLALRLHDTDIRSASADPR